MLALAWELVAERSHDEPGFATEALDALRLHYDWLQRHRDPDRDGLISIIHPDESGLDDSPKYDPVFGWMSHYLPGYFWLVERSRRLGYDSRAIIARYEEHVEDVLVNVFYALSLRALARLTGDDDYHARASRTEQALIERCWDEDRGLFWDLAGRDHVPLQVSTWSSLAPLALPSLPEAIAKRLIEEHLLHPLRYRARYGIPSVSMDEPSFRAGWHLFRCWRGPAWINTVWLLVPAMRRLGYASEADRIVASSVELVERHGFREYYNPINGEGLAARRFGWSTLLVDLLPRPMNGGGSRRRARSWAASRRAVVDGDRGRGRDAPTADPGGRPSSGRGGAGSRGSANSLRIRTSMRCMRPHRSSACPAQQLSERPSSWIDLA